MENSDKKQELEETLIQAGLRTGYFTLIEGVYDPGILKAVFMAGGPGSGKSAVANTVFNMPPESKKLAPSGLKIVGSDPAFEHLLKKAGIDLDLSKLSDEVFDRITDKTNPNSIRSRANDIMLQQYEHYKNGRIGVIIDGTAHDQVKIIEQKKMLENLGYDCYMIYVNTTLDVAQARNQLRPRKLKRKVVKKKWVAVQKNQGAFSGMFGRNFIIVDNSEDLRSKTKPGKLNLVPIILKQIARFISRKVINPKGHEWISLMKNHDKMTKSGDKINRTNEASDWKMYL